MNPNEKILIGSLQKFSIEDGPGIRTTIFVKGCPLNCKWCHNPELIDPQQELIKSPNNCIGCGHCIKICPQGSLTMNPEKGILIDRTTCNICLKCTKECFAKALRPVAKPMTIEEIMHIAKEDKGFYDNTGGGITVSGGEILIYGDFIKQLIKAAAKQEIKVCLDTSGYGKFEDLLEMAFMENVQFILYDIKSVDDEIHQKYTGRSNHRILENLKLLAKEKAIIHKLIMRMPLIKDINDSNSLIEQTGDLYKKIGIQEVHLLPYHPIGISKKTNVGGFQEKFESPSEERIYEIKKYFEKKIHLKVEVLGKI